MFTEDDIPEPTRTGRAKWGHTQGGPNLGTADIYMLTTLKSAANWLATRSQMAWAKQYHHSNLMGTYADTLTGIHAKLEKVIAAQQKPITRYNHYAAGPDQDEAGEWVRYEDHIALMAGKEQTT